MKVARPSVCVLCSSTVVPVQLFYVVDYQRVVHDIKCDIKGNNAVSLFGDGY